jgi:hypothetical protein
MRQWWLFSVFLIMFAGHAHAGPGCEPVDLRPLIGAPFDQGDSSYCFAHTASTLIQAKLGVRASPMHLATHYILTNPSELSGPADPEVKKLLTPGFFEYWKHDLATQKEWFQADRILGEKGLLDTGGEEMPTLLIANFLGLCPESRLPTGYDVYKPYLASINEFHRVRALRGIPEAELREPLAEVEDTEARGKAWSFRHWVENRCGRPIMPLRPLVPRSVSLAPNLEVFRRLEKRGLLTLGMRNQVLQAIDAGLDRGQPISFGYAFADLISEKSPAAGLAEVDHASVIAGRRKVGGKCYYFVRNSFGDEQDDGYYPKFKGRLESGGVWVLPEEIPSLYSAVWLE